MTYSQTHLLKWAFLLQSAIGSSALFVPPWKPHNQMPALQHLSPRDPQLHLREGAPCSFAAGATEGQRNFTLLVVVLCVVSIGSVFGLLLQLTMHYAGLSPGTRVATELCLMSLGMILLLVHRYFSNSVRIETILVLCIPAVGFFSMIAGVETKIVSELAKRGQLRKSCRNSSSSLSWLGCMCLSFVLSWI